MNTEQPVNIKQRIVGAIVLVSLAIIFLPMILKDRAHYPNHQDVEIPPAPKNLQALQERVIHPVSEVSRIEPPPMPKPKAIPWDEKNQKVVKQSIERKQLAKKMAEDKPKRVKSESKSQADKPKSNSAKNNTANKKKINQSYAIQLGSFGSQKNAVDLKRKLQKNQYKAYIEVVRTSKGLRHRVRVGPYLKYDQISAIRKKINRRFKIDGKIVNYR